VVPQASTKHPEEADIHRKTMSWRRRRIWANVERNAEVRQRDKGSERDVQPNDLGSKRSNDPCGIEVVSKSLSERIQACVTLLA